MVSGALPLVRLSFPLSLTYLAEFALVFTDMVIVGRLGARELGAVSISIDVLFSLLMVPTGILSMTSVFVADAVARKDVAATSRYIGTSMMLAAAMSVPGMAVALALPPAFQAVGYDSEIVSDMRSFMNGLWLSVFPTLGAVALRQTLAAMGAARPVAWMTVLAIAANLLLDIALVFGTPVSPRLGVFGAGLATTIVSWLAFAAFAVVLFYRHPAVFSHMVRATLLIHVSIVRHFLRVGGPVGLASLFEYGGFVVIAAMMGTLGPDVLAANQIVFNFIFIVSMISYGIGDAAAILISGAVGAKEQGRCSNIGLSALAITLITVSLVALVILLYPGFALAIFIDVGDAKNSTIVTIAMQILVVAALFQAFEGFQAVIARLLRGVQETKTVFLASFIGYWVFGVFGGALAIWHLGMGGVAVWCFLTVGLLFMVGILAAKYQSVFRRLDAAIA
jgi:MATE family multidrug resistance protein